MSAVGFGLVYGLAAREAGLSPVEVLAMSALVLAGAAQFAAVGLLAAGAPWPAIVAVTAFLNARHLFYAASMAPWLRAVGRLHRGAMAHVLTDETFALALAHFRRIGRADVLGYWVAAAVIAVPWVAATLAGAIGGAAIVEPERFGLDVVFPAAMAGLTVSLIERRADLLAAFAAVALAVPVGLAWHPAGGIVTAALVAPLLPLVLGLGPSTAGAPEGRS